MIVYVYSVESASSSSKKLNYIKRKLASIYKNIIVISFDELPQINNYEIDVLIFSGGDGIFNHIINYTVENKKITYGYIPLGTANDIGHNLNLGSYKKAIEIINKGCIKKYNLIEYDGGYFFYALSVGNMSIVSTKAKKLYKKVFHKIVYKIRGLRYMFKPSSNVTLMIGKTKKELKLKLLLVLRTKYLGGVKIASSINERLEIICIKNLFDLFSFFVFKRHKSILTSKLFIKSNSSWCCDGESLDKNESLIKISDKQIKLFVCE